MHTAPVKRLPVINERGQLLGTVSRADLLKVPYLVRAVHHVEGGGPGRKQAQLRRRRRPGDGLSLDAPVSARGTRPSHLLATTNIVACRNASSPRRSGSRMPSGTRPARQRGLGEGTEENPCSKLSASQES